MTTIVARAWGQALDGYARLILPSGCAEPEAGGPEFSYHQVLAPGELGDGNIMAELICRKRPLTVGKLERHLATPEILVALDAGAVVCVAPPGADPASCRPSDIRALPLRQGQALWMDRGVWHWLPFPVRAGQVTMLLIFREGTGDRDIEFRELAEPVGIEAGSGVSG